jgi:trans-aconitate methyltransferase
VSQYWPELLRRLQAQEAKWALRKIDYPREDAVGFIPYGIPQFVVLLIDALAACRGRPSFLDVGCGPGTKCQIAAAFFVRAHGIDLDPEMIAEAKARGASDVTAEVADAFTWDRYGEFAIVYVNRPSTLQDKLEKRVCDLMAPGAVLIACNWRNDPATLAGFELVAQEWGEPVRGVWRKPAG